MALLFESHTKTINDKLEWRAPPPPDYGNVIPQIPSDVELLDLNKCTGDVNIPPFKDFAPCSDNFDWALVRCLKIRGNVPLVVSGLGKLAKCPWSV